MATTDVTVDGLLRQVAVLPDAKQDEFLRRFAARRAGRSPRRVRARSKQEEGLIQTTRLRLNKHDDRRIRQRTAKSEAGELSRDEIREYQRLARRAEELSVVRLRALAELV